MIDPIFRRDIIFILGSMFCMCSTSGEVERRKNFFVFFDFCGYITPSNSGYYLHSKKLDNLELILVLNYTLLHS